MFGFLFNPEGRVSRAQMWLFFLGSMLAYAVAGALDVLAGTTLPTGAGMISGLLGLFLIWPSIAVPVKRFHDRGMSGWWILLPLAVMFGGVFFALLVVGFSAASAMAPAAGDLAGVSEGAGGTGAILLVSLVVLCVCLWQFVVLYLLPGQDGINRFGPDPRDGPARGAPDDGWGVRLASSAAGRSPQPDGAVLSFMQSASAPAVAASAAAPASRPRRNIAQPGPGEWGFGHRHPSRFRPSY